ncbi:MAG: hypothetical protein PHP13_05375 [Methanomicrobium sp.]|nr:hypothetical protein [Methanomicrobium sp.]
MSEEESTKIVWERQIPLFSNNVLLKQLSVAILISAFFVMMLLIVLDPDMIIDAFMVFLLLVGILGVLAVIAMALIQAATRGGLSAEFSLDDFGMHYEAKKHSKSLNRLTAIGGILAGSPSLLGGSMINISRESEFMSWDEVKKITAYDSQKTIVAYRKSLISPMGLFCTDENYAETKEYIKNHLPKGVSLKRK